MSLIGSMLGDRYRVCEFVGKGGMALVYRAEDIRTGHQVALKVLRAEFSNDEEFLTRFEREAMAASRMQHHNIVNLLDVGTDGDMRYLVMEYVNGRTLKEIIEENQGLRPELAVQIAVRILSALQHAHDNGIIHRDIKPQNILINNSGMVKVADFGIARMAGSMTVSKPDTIVGSVHYFSPEQAKSYPVTASSDIYSVGVVMYEMLTGHVPFDADSPVAIALKHINMQPPPMSNYVKDIPPAVEYVVMKALEKDKRRRYQSAYEMAQDLKRANKEPAGDWIKRAEPAGESVMAPKRSDVERRRRKRVRVMGTVLITLVLLGVIGFGCYTLYDRIFNMTTVPDVLGEDETRAVTMIERVGLVAHVSQINHASAAGTVISQMPEDETTSRKGSTVLITVSKGPQASAVPALQGLLLDDANIKLQGLNLPIAFEDARVVSDLPIGTIIAQSPDAESELPSDKVIHVTVSGGTAVVPDVKGMSMAAGGTLLSDCGLQIGIVLYESTDVLLQSGVIYEQSIEPNTAVIQKTKISLHAWEMDNAPYNAAVMLTLPAAETETALWVTVVETDGREFIRYKGSYDGSNAVSKTVSLKAQSQGKLNYRVYVDKSMIYEGSVAFE